jgi:hypothetical protein
MEVVKPQPEIVQEWAKILNERLKKKLTKFKISYSDSLRRSIRTDVMRAVGGDVDKVRLLYNYYGAFIDMGVGRGQKIDEVKYTGKLLRVVGGTGRKPKKWYSVTITAECNTLADLMMKHYGHKGMVAVTEQIPTKINM